MELTMFERLMQLPLFQGLSTQEFSEVMAHVRLDFVNYQAGDEVVMQDEPCRNLVYIISGNMSAEYRDAAGRFLLKEELPPIGVIEPYNLFGMYQKYSRTYIFDTEGSTLTISKNVVLNNLMASQIVKINMLNITCNRYHQALKTLCEVSENTVEEKIYKFILSYSSVARGTKDLKIKMTDLSDMLHETRLNVSKALNKLQEKKLLTLYRGGFIVHDLRLLQAYLQEQ